MRTPRGRQSPSRGKGLIFSIEQRLADKGRWTDQASNCPLSDDIHYIKMRREERQRVSRPARVELGDGKTLTCRIADVSRGGALLLIQDGDWLPDVFELFDTFGNVRRDVRVVWTASNRVGVRFLSAGPSRSKKPTGFGRR
jgi:hypothetical protein